MMMKTFLTRATFGITVLALLLGVTTVVRTQNPVMMFGSFSGAAKALAVDTNGNLKVSMAGGIGLFGDGTACSAPSISFASSPTTGFYLTGGQVFTCIGGSNVGGFDATGLSVNQTILHWTDIYLKRTGTKTLTVDADGVGGLLTQINLSAPVVVSSTLNVQGSQITAGTDVTTTNPGDTTISRYQFTITPASGGAANCATQAAGFKAAALTADCVIATIPAGVKIIGAYADVTAGFTCSGTCTGTKVFTAGISAGGTEIFAAGLNVVAVARFGLADADMGSQLTRAAAIQGGYLPSWTATTPLTARFTSGTGNWGNGASTFVNAGSIKITLLTVLVK